MAQLKKQKPLSYPSTTLLLEYFRPSLRLLVAHRCPTLPKLIDKLQIERLYYGPSWFQIDDNKFELNIKPSLKRCFESTNSRKVNILELTVVNTPTAKVIMKALFKGTGDLMNAMEHLLKKYLTNKTTIKTVRLHTTILNSHMELLEKIITYDLETIELEKKGNGFFVRRIFNKAKKVVKMCESPPNWAVCHKNVHYAASSSWWCPAMVAESHADLSRILGLRHYTVSVHDLNHAMKCMEKLSTAENFVAGTIQEIRNTQFGVCYTIPNAFAEEQECNVYITKTTEIDKSGEQETTFLLNIKQNVIGFAAPL